MGTIQVDAPKAAVAHTTALTVCKVIWSSLTTTATNPRIAEDTLGDEISFSREKICTLTKVWYVVIPRTSFIQDIHPVNYRELLADVFVGWPVILLTLSTAVGLIIVSSWVWASPKLRIRLGSGPVSSILGVAAAGMCIVILRQPWHWWCWVKPGGMRIHGEEADEVTQVADSGSNIFQLWTGPYSTRNYY